MAKVHEENIVITVSKLVKNDQDIAELSFVNDEALAALASVAEELLGDGVVVEINRA